MKKQTKKKIITLLIAIIITFLGGLKAKDTFLPVENNLEVHFIDVGQGDSTLLISQGETLLIDGGERDYSSKVISYIENLGIEEIDYMIATHPHSDHISGLVGVLNKFKVKNVIRNEEEVDTRVFKSFVKLCDEKDINVTIPKVGDKFTFGEVEFTIIGPTAYNFDTNNNSIATRVVHGKNSLIFTGDGESMEESTLMYTGEEIKSKIYHVGHHGSRKATSKEFLEEVNPEYAVISLGKDNMYGHPHKEVLNRLEENDVKIFRTDLMGSIIMVSDGKEVLFSSEK
ncbi:MBL fold metallo-hydrolase [Peptostreptococcaceae bacterium OttesenSCG-928-C18]|nr:MBL fold metallo-hydrolase [Peptostreptococcaceae bacterium OttesenSCG-928-C18]